MPASQLQHPLKPSFLKSADLIAVHLKTASDQLKWSFNVHLFEEPSHSVTVPKTVAYFKIIFQHYHNKCKVDEIMLIASLTILNESLVYVQEDRGYTRTSGETCITRDRISNHTEYVVLKLYKKTPSLITRSQK
jgi:hypothetical protein